MKAIFLATTILATAALPLAAGAVQPGIPATILAQATTPGASWDRGRPLPTDEITGLRGRTIIDENGNEIGRIEEVVRGGDDEPHAVIEVGRTLGLGDKTIAVPLGQLRRTGRLLILSPTTTEQLDSIPDYRQSKFRAWEQPESGAGKADPPRR